MATKNTKSAKGGRTAQARELLREIIADEAKNLGWGPDVTNLGKLKRAHALLAAAPKGGL